MILLEFNSSKTSVINDDLGSYVISYVAALNRDLIIGYEKDLVGNAIVMLLPHYKDGFVIKGIGKRSFLQ